MKEPKYLIDYGIKVEVTHLKIGGEKIKPPIGLSELLEPIWVIPTEEMLEKMQKDEEEIERKYERYEYKNEKGHWVTKYTLKKSDNT
ncbi:hypothetical protein [Solibacillus daqui]|uniref:hypothetical protein n=1 Tax=Solibacillus daqui TaxID=2912187 RepID=UPI00236722A3|nr:hypothetical protein [Solibacillus daqui]